MTSSTQDLSPVVHLGDTFRAVFIGAAFAAIKDGGCPAPFLMLVHQVIFLCYANFDALTEVVWSGKVRSTLAVSSINDIEGFVQLQIAFNTHSTDVHLIFERDYFYQSRYCIIATMPYPHYLPYWVLELLDEVFLLAVDSMASRPSLHARELDLEASRLDVFKHHLDKKLHPARTVQPEAAMVGSFMLTE
ncbi:hypothetical protein M405DRAFT_845290 [Rhizopogon salebrosus TDB-379]|nr:hypothetical protein M405DRAFT_845290 [Rhizopogon salebrosus TDB-379]